MSMTRRRFVQRSLAGAAALGVPLVVSPRVWGANDEVRVGVVGLGGRGMGAHIPGMANQKGVTVVAVCDADRQRMEAAARLVAEKYQVQVDSYVDMRKMFERKDIDVIANATQNYWHGLSTIWACQAGKHVYVEKPLSHYIWEGRQMVDAARKYQRIVQCGTQWRSSGAMRAMAEWLRAGNLGKIQYVVAFANKPRRSVGKRATPLEIPPTIDYDLWCGPAQKLPIYRDRLQYDCSFDWNTGDGESCNQGVHEVDCARWVLGESSLPRRVMSIGGRFVVDDAANVPNTQIIYYDFPTAPILYEVHNLPKAKKFLTPEGWNNMPDFKGQRVGIYVHCEGGYAMRTTAYDHQGKAIKTFSGGGDHFVNFIEAVRAGQPELLNADVLEGHLSTAVCHTGNISYRVGAPAPVAEQRKAVAGIPVWNEMYERYLAYLKDLEIDPATSILGPWLEVDQARECFKEHDEANRLVRGFYRDPYRLPDLSG